MDNDKNRIIGKKLHIFNYNCQYHGFPIQIVIAKHCYFAVIQNYSIEYVFFYQITRKQKEFYVFFGIG